jgi:hypothetical protein
VIPIGLDFCVISQPSNQADIQVQGLLFGTGVEYRSRVLTPSATLKALMGYGVATSKQSCRHLSDAERETLSQGLVHGYSSRRALSLGGSCR